MGDSEVVYKPTSDFEENDKNPLLDISSMDSDKELWLLQWPSNQVPDLNGQEVRIKLNGDGTLGCFVSSSGKSYELASFASQEPDATVFQSSASGSKVVGNISRRVSLIHYFEPSEMEKSNTIRDNQFYQRTAGTSSISRHKNASGISQVTRTPSQSSRQRSSLFETGESSKRSKKRHDRQPMGSMNQFTQDSTGQDQSGVSSLGSAENSRRKSNQIKHE